jgi:hypothetical protein
MNITKNNKAQRTEDISLLALVFIIVFMFVACLGVWVGRSYFEAKAYNKITNSNVTTIDAMFIQLRVEGKSGNE